MELFASRARLTNIPVTERKGEERSVTPQQATPSCMALTTGPATHCAPSPRDMARQDAVAVAGAGAPRWPIAFALIYFTFFLDNVLLTVLVPIIPDWIRGSSLQQWTEHAAPLATLLNSTVRHAPGVGASQAVVGLVLSAKALVQLACAGPAAAAVCRLGAPRVLRRATALLLCAATVFAACSGRSGGGAALAAGAARAAQGAGAAGAGVAGLALAAAAAPPSHRDRAIGALLGAVALGVLVGYPFGGATYALWSRAAPFLVIAAALALNLGLQYVLLDKEEFNQMCVEDAAAGGGGGSGSGWLAAMGAARGESAGCAGACAGAVLLTTSVMAALEPCLPIWIMDKFHPQRWVTGAVFVPDSAAYLAATSLLGGAARALGAERVALAGQAAVAGAALALPYARYTCVCVCVLAASHKRIYTGRWAGWRRRTWRWARGWARWTRRWCRRCWRARVPRSRHTAPRCCRRRARQHTRWARRWAARWRGWRGSRPPCALSASPTCCTPATCTARSPGTRSPHSGGRARRTRGRRRATSWRPRRGTTSSTRTLNLAVGGSALAGRGGGGERRAWILFYYFIV